MENVPAYELHLRMSDKASGSAKMTVLLFVIDLMKGRTGISKMQNNETQVNFDEDNMTNTEEILQTKMEEVLIKRVGVTNPFGDNLEAGLADNDAIYLNDKE